MLFQFDLFNYGLIDATYQENGNKCRFTLAKEPVSAFYPASFGFAKNGPYTKIINQLYLFLFDKIITNYNKKFMYI